MARPSVICRQRLELILNDPSAFSPRDAMHSAVYAVARRCQPVRLSVTRRYCVETAKHIKLFSIG